MVRKLTFILAICATFSGYAQIDVNKDGLVDVLVPITVGDVDTVIPGAHGSLWSSELWLHNSSDVDIDVIQRDVFCNIPFTCDYYRRGETVRTGVASADPGMGALLTFHPLVAPRVTLSARLLEHSRRSQPNGIDLPIVWEENFLSRPARMIAIPSRPEGRVMLRVYDPAPSENASSVKVEAFSTDGTPLGSATLILERRVEANSFEPGYAAIGDIQAAFPNVAAHERFDLLVTPLHESQMFYSFVSETDRDTQHVLLIQPNIAN